MVLGQLFSRETQAIFYNYKEKPVQRMLDFDFVAGGFNAQGPIVAASHTPREGREPEPVQRDASHQSRGL